MTFVVLVRDYFSAQVFVHIPLSSPWRSPEDPNDFRQTLGRFPTGVTIVTTLDANLQPVGLTVSSFNAVSLQPPLVLWSLSNSAQVRASFEQAPCYAIHVLSATQQILARAFAKGSANTRFEAVPLLLHDDATGLPLLPGCTAVFICQNRSRYVEGDHTIFVAKVLRCQFNEDKPLIYHAGRYDLTPDVTAG